MAFAISFAKSAKFILFGLIAIGSCSFAIGNQPQLPDCESVEESRAKTEPIGSLLLVSTLDGRLTALNSEEGDLKWELNTGPGALLASTIKQLQMSRDGQWSHIVHSLEGDLFTLGGDSIQPMPLRVDDLLSASLKVTDDTVITGGKESRTFGILPSSGEIRYSCSINDCQKYEKSDDDGPVLVVQRKVQTVRAICPMSGIEKWNFSVGNHEVVLVGNYPSGCHAPGGENSKLRDVGSTNVQFVAPEGTVMVLSPSNPSEIVWKYEFSSPIAHAWKLEDGVLNALDLFENSYHTRMIGEDGRNHEVKPAVYVGTYQDLLYLQRSHAIREQDVLYQQNLMTDKSGHFSKVTWKPFFVARKSVEPWLITEESSSVTENTALVIREAEDVIYEDDNGFYLFALPPTKKTNDQRMDYSSRGGCNVKSIWHQMFSNKKTAMGAALPNNSYPFGMKIPIYNISDNDPLINDTLTGSLWHWWKEILAISVTFAIFVNVLIFKAVTRRLRQKIKEENACVEVKPSPASSSGSFKPEVEIPYSRTSSETISMGSNADANFESRYLTDFEPIQRLGKGGFGLVVEARNKIDDCHYAIKRICLPNREEARKKVMREVKALAKLDHVGIVRYYNAWLECPPPGWQESKDRELDKDDSVTHESLSCRQTPSTSRVISSCERIATTWSISNSSEKDCEEESGSFSCGKVGEGLRNISGGHGDCRNSETNDSFIVFQDSGCEEKYAEDEAGEAAVTNTVTRTRLVSLSGENLHKPTRVYLYIQMQLCRKESLRDWLVANSKTRDKRTLLDMFEQIVGAVDYVHSQGLMHRDLKPSNIFFAIDGTIKVGDFGLVTAMPEGLELESPMASLESHHDFLNHTDQVGTQLYMSPEQIQKLPYDQKVDIFSLGLIFFEMLIPFATQMERQKILTDARQNVFPQEFSKIHPAECKMVKQLLAFDPCKRPSANDIMDDPLLDSLRCAKQDGVLMRSRRRSRTFSQTFSPLD